MNRRILSVFMVFVMLCAMASGCKKNVGTSEDNAIVEEDDTEKNESRKFGFSCITMENPYFITLEQSMRETLEGKGHTLIVKDPADDPDLQIEQIHSMIEEGIDAIFISPVSWDAVTPALEELHKAGIPIINVDTQVKDMIYVDAYVGSDNKTAGKLCAQDLIAQRPEGGKILILESAGQNSVIERITGFEQEIANKGFEIIARADTKGELNAARDAASKVFQENKDITAVMCGNDQIALGALVAAHTAGAEDVMIYGVDGSPDLKKELLKPESRIRGTSGQSAISIGKDAALTGMAILEDREYEKEIYEEVFFISAENIEMYGADGWQ